MSEAFVMTIGRDALVMATILAGPMLAVSLLLGVVVSLFQAVTQINEATLTFVPKVIGMGAIMLVLGPWMLQHILRYTSQLFQMLPYMVQ